MPNEFSNSAVFKGEIKHMWDQICAPGNWLTGPKHPQTEDVYPFPGESAAALWNVPGLGYKFYEITKSGKFKQLWLWEVITYKEHEIIAYRGTTFGLSAMLSYSFTQGETHFTYTRRFTINTTNLLTTLAFPLFREDIKDSGRTYISRIIEWWNSR